MKTKSLIVVALTVACVGILFACLYKFTIEKRYLVRTYLEGRVVAIWNEDEAFIFIRKTISGVSGSQGRLFLKELRERFLQHEYERGDLIVVHIKDGKLEKHTFERFGSSGGPYPVHGVIYYQMITNEAEYPAVWRWAGTNFDKVDKTEARNMLSSFSMMSDLLVKEGWHVENSLFVNGEKSVPIQLKPEQFKLILKLQTTYGQDVSTALIQGRTNHASEEILAQESSEYRPVDKKTYVEVFR